MMPDSRKNTVYYSHPDSVLVKNDYLPLMLFFEFLSRTGSVELEITDNDDGFFKATLNLTDDIIRDLVWYIEQNT